MKKANLENQASQILAVKERTKRRRQMTKTQAEMLAHEYNRTFIKDRLAQSEEPDFDLTQYVQCNRHRQGCPAWMKPRHLDVLIRYVPGQLGLGMDIKDIAKDLKLSRRQIHRIIETLQLRFPAAMGRVDAMRKCMFRQLHNVRQKKRSLDGMLAALDEGGVHDELVEIL